MSAAREALEQSPRPGLPEQLKCLGLELGDLRFELFALPGA